MQAAVHEVPPAGQPAATSRHSSFGTKVAEIVRPQRPVASPQRRDGCTAGQVAGATMPVELVIGDLDGVIDPVVERIRPVRARAPPRARRGAICWASVLTVWTETCHPASFARPMVSVSSAGSQWRTGRRRCPGVIFRPRTREAVPDGLADAVGVPVAEMPPSAPARSGRDRRRRGAACASWAARASSSSSRSRLTHCSEMEVQPRLQGGIHRLVSRVEAGVARGPRSSVRGHR